MIKTLYNILSNIGFMAKNNRVILNKKGFEMDFLAKLILALIVLVVILIFLGMKYQEELMYYFDIFDMW